MKKYLSLVKFSHSIFAMPFAILGFVMSLVIEKKDISYITLFLVIACMVFARNVAMAFNRLIDAVFDEKNERTKAREIPAGIIKKNQAVIFIALNILAFITSTYFINSLCFYLSPIALFVIMGYSYTKRFSFLCHIILGIGLGLAPIGAFLAMTAYFKLYIVGLGFGVLLWVCGFDIIYALQDFSFDKAQGLYSIPTKMGIHNARKLAVLFHVICAFIFLLMIYSLSLNVVAYVAWILFCYFLIRQHRVINLNDLSKINFTFFTNNGKASLAFCVLLIIDLFFFKA